MLNRLLCCLLPSWCSSAETRSLLPTRSHPASDQYLNHGSHGFVVRSNEGGRDVVVKHLRRASGRVALNPRIKAFFANEAKALKSIHRGADRLPASPFVIHLLREDWCGNYLVLPSYGDSTDDLHTLTCYSHPLSYQQVITMVLQMTQALIFLQERGWLHCDVKTENMLVQPLGPELGVDCRFRLILIDFGYAKQITAATEVVEASACYFPSSSELLREDETLLGTPGYMAPEVCFLRRWTRCSDVWSVGAVLFELLTNKNFMNKRAHNESLLTLMYRYYELHSQAEFHIRPTTFFNSRIAYFQEVTHYPKLQHLLLRMLTAHPDRRISLSQLSADLQALGASDTLTSLSNALASGALPC